MTDQDRAVMALSVYNALALSRKNMTAAEVAAFLRMYWNPITSRNVERISVQTVSEALGRLAVEGLVLFDGQVALLTTRDKSGFGRPMELDNSWTKLVPANTPLSGAVQ